ncbi:MAG: cytochrome P450, partial [Gammaproteobacteria bacterium]|nr:cytochrome P450 [Gammaproteobacteria bacterium]
NPNTFDITRKQTNPLSFGGGIHICLGMHLARLELEKVFAKLVSRFPRMQLVEKHPARLDAFHQQTYAKVEVIFEP